MDNQKELIVNFINWAREHHDITLEEWFGPECESVNKSSIEEYVDEYLGEISE